jgi:hypothetical protein
MKEKRAAIYRRVFPYLHLFSVSQGAEKTPAILARRKISPKQ